MQSQPYDGDVFFSVDVETDGPIPGPYSMLSFALAPAGRFDGERFERASRASEVFYAELAPISERFDPDAMAVNGLDRDALLRDGEAPAAAMARAAEFIEAQCEGGTPVLVAYPLTFDGTWLYWYFVNFLGASPFRHSRGFDIKTAVAVKAKRRLSEASRTKLPAHLVPEGHPHTHHARDDAVEQAEIFARVFEWEPTA